MANILFGGSNATLNMAFGDTQVQAIAIGETEVWTRPVSLAISITAPTNTTVTTGFSTIIGGSGTAFSSQVVITADDNYVVSGSGALVSDDLPDSFTYSTVFSSGTGNTATITISGNLPDSDVDTTATVPGLSSSNKFDVDYLLLGGGGSGAYANNSRTAGGGAGGMKTSYGGSLSGKINGGQDLDSSEEFASGSGTVYTITVGTGAPQPVFGNSGTSGGNSSIVGAGTSVIATGGAGGMASVNNPPGGTAGTNGFGGGLGSTFSSGGGGGGTGGAGVEETAGPGQANEITGSSITYGKGGAGNKNVQMAANTGIGDGGHGRSGVAALTYSTAGNDGIVILRMPTAFYSGTTTGNPTVTTSGSDTIISWTSNGTYTA